jgi:neutral ceramidase
MNNTNRLITSDNKGYAAYRLERDFNGGVGSFPGKGPFIAAFSTSNEVRAQRCSVFECLCPCVE